MGTTDDDNDTNATKNIELSSLSSNQKTTSSSTKQRSLTISGSQSSSSSFSDGKSDSEYDERIPGITYASSSDSYYPSSTSICRKRPPPRTSYEATLTPLPMEESSDDDDEDDMFNFNPLSANNNNNNNTRETSPEEIILEAVDRIEDEIDEWSFKHFIPLPIRLFFEHYVFGWSHLCSDILGHILYPLLSSLLTYYLYTYLVFGFDTAISHDDISVYDKSVLSHFIFIVNRIFFQSTSLEHIIYLHSTSFFFLRILMTSFSAIISYRTVRRRVNVWLRNPYGSRGYKRDSAMRDEEVKDVDRTTLLGRLRRRHVRWMTRRVENKIERAQKTFERRRRLKIRKKQRRNNRWKRGYDDVSSGEDDDDRGDVSSRSHLEELKSLCHDQHRLSEAIEVVPYAHGGFFGSAPFMLADPRWIDILRTLMPDVYVEVARRAFYPSAKLIHWAENNPVMAAYGTWNELKQNGTVTTVEWDVFLDPGIVEKLETLLDERDWLVKTLMEQTPRPSSSSTIDDYDSSSSEDSQAEFDALLSHENSNPTPNYYSNRHTRLDEDIKKCTSLLLDQMVIAHGNGTQLILEQTGYLKRYVFSRVKRTRRTLGGGIYAKQWLAVYAEALRMGMMLQREEERQGYYDDTTDGDAALGTRGGLGDMSSPLTSQATGESSSSFNEMKGRPNPNPNTVANEQPVSHDSHTAMCTICHKSIGKRPKHKGHRHHRCCSCHNNNNHNHHSQDSPHLHNNNNYPPQQRKPLPPTTSLRSLTHSICPNTTIPQSLSLITPILNGTPISLFFDVKSRHIPQRVWALLIDLLRSYGARVDALGMFNIDELRGVSDLTKEPVKEAFIFHSAGDVQKACHEGLLREGDVLFFNAGSLLWDWEESKGGLCHIVKRWFCERFDREQFKRNYRPMSYADFDKDYDDGADDTNHQYRHLRHRGSTLKDYKEAYNLSIGMYLQEFAIDEEAADCLVKHVNRHLDVFNLGLAWGGVNGVTISGIQPGKFSHSDGFWSQRYIGASWNPKLFPCNVAGVGDDDETRQKGNDVDYFLSKY